MRAGGNGEQSADKIYTSVRQLTERPFNRILVPLRDRDPAKRIVRH